MLLQLDQNIFKFKSMFSLQSSVSTKHFNTMIRHVFVKKNFKLSSEAKVLKR